MKRVAILRSFVRAFLISTFIISLASCQKDWTESGLIANVEKTTPKQALISFTTVLPEDFKNGRTEKGVLYSTSEEVKPGAATEVAAASGASSIILKHLECGTTYNFRLYVKHGGEYHLGKQLSFTTEPLPKYAIDLGLSNDVLWADRNIGADSPDGNGEVFAYGELFEKEKYNVDNYRLYKSEDCRPAIITKYSIPDGYVQESWYVDRKFSGDGKYILEPEDDVVTQRLGEGWKTPDVSDFEVLLKETTYKDHTRGTATGTLFSAENGASLFIPNSWMNTNAGKYETTMGIYWSSQLRTGGYPSRTTKPRSDYASALNVSGKYSELFCWPRHYGYPVRGVYDCSIEERTYGSFPEAEATSFTETPSILVYGTIAADPSDPTLFTFRARSEEQMHPASFIVDMVFRNLDDMKPGDEVKPTSIRCWQPLSSSSTISTNKYLGSIYFESRTEDMVTLKWENVRFNISSRFFVINCTVECRIES